VFPNEAFLLRFATALLMDEFSPPSEPCRSLT